MPPRLRDHHDPGKPDLPNRHHSINALLRPSMGEGRKTDRKFWIRCVYPKLLSGSLAMNVLAHISQNFCLPQRKLSWHCHCFSPACLKILDQSTGFAYATSPQPDHSALKTCKGHPQP